MHPAGPEASGSGVAGGGQACGRQIAEFKLRAARCSVNGGGPTPAHNGHSPEQPGHSVTGGGQARGRPIAGWRCFKAQ